MFFTICNSGKSDRSENALYFCRNQISILLNYTYSGTGWSPSISRSITCKNQIAISSKNYILYLRDLLIVKSHLCTFHLQVKSVVCKVPVKYSIK